ncbi:hypothetical protein AIOL_001744 [Candidatus Rhodobacter oscarellae]|uniref:Uncharacterized protein n=1 Tax=Candidatus Rhodobacter oscarellae TaxID=1675527 RepID=A0A0J9GTG4_9RHOB|nr:DUF4344 domain-containing metallopeptidase [Candidatus Rhodobacter lobularis]KMW56788.1 hypothetical protein AIOL_001744 [Candidatus Rhodobacter lobularis]
MIDALNDELSLAAPLTVTVESCGEPNGFYDLDARAIIMCSAFEDHLFEMAKQLN